MEIAVRNERTKLTATYINGVAIAILPLEVLRLSSLRSIVAMVRTEISLLSVPFAF